MTSVGRVLIVSWDGGGNTTPAFALGARLVQRGHQVTMLGWPSMVGPAASARLEFCAYEAMPAWPDGETMDEAWDEVAVPMLRGPSVRDEIVEVARRCAADVLVIDCMMGAAYRAAERLGLPTAVLVHVRYRPFVELWGDGTMGESVSELLAAAEVALALTAPGFDGDSSGLPANVTYVGPILPAAGGPAFVGLTEPGPPWVLVSLGTTQQGQEAVLSIVLEAVRDLPIRVVLTLGGVSPKGSLAVPAQVTVRDYVPHAQVLPYVAAVICHGGLSTVTAALAYGVPLVCLPLGREQPLNAQAVQASGAGRNVPADASPATIAEALTAVLDDPAIRAAALRFARGDAGAEAVEAVEGLLDERRVSASV